jgi:mRNA-degrading endonuclease RelE of RelBE toxin-antitoxin system
MTFRLRFKPEAEDRLNNLKNDRSQQAQYKAVLKCLGFLETNRRHPSLHTHEFTSMKGQNNEKVYTAYAQQNRPAAYRVFWHYGPKEREITIITITPHL